MAKLLRKSPDEKLRMVIPVHFDAITLMAVAGACQLALRHPEYKGPSSELVKNFAEQSLRKLKEEGVLTDAELLTAFQDFTI
jgi:hypothetical protein